MINKQFGRKSDFKPRFQFNQRRFNPYPRQPRLMYSTNPRPFSQTTMEYLLPEEATSIKTAILNDHTT